jgi:hypothetical protein
MSATLPKSAAASVRSIDFVPQAILDVPLSHFSDKFGLEIESSQDDFDEYDGAYQVVDDVLMAIRHYAGHPPNTATLYFPSTVKDLETITDLIGAFTQHFGLTSGQLQWQRKDNPDL